MKNWTKLKFEAKRGGWDFDERPPVKSIRYEEGRNGKPLRIVRRLRRVGRAA